MLHTFFATVNELPSMHSLNSKESLSQHAVLVWVTELNFCQGSSAAWIMHNVLYIIIHVTMCSERTTTDNCVLTKDVQLVHQNLTPTQNSVIL